MKSTDWCPTWYWRAGSSSVCWWHCSPASGSVRASGNGPGEILWVVRDKTDAMLMDAERREHARELQESNARLTSSLQAAEIRAKEIVLLTELSSVLQSCQAPNEIFAAVQNYAGF